METGCQYPQCRGSVPLVLEREGLCPLHFLRKVDAECSDIRRDAMLGRLDSARCEQVNQFLVDRALVLAQLATSGTRLRDEARPCLLSVFLTLVNVCERLARASNGTGNEPELTTMHRPLAAAVK